MEFEITLEQLEFLLGVLNRANTLIEDIEEIGYSDEYGNELKYKLAFQDLQKYLDFA